MPKGIPARFTKEEIALMIELRRQNVSARLIAERLKENGHHTCERVVNRKLLNLGYPAAHNGCFQKGMTPWNKNKKGYMGANAGSFKKGQRPPSWRPVGSIRTSLCGQVEVKTAEPKTWRPRSHLVWEKHHGPIPKGYIVFHINSDPQDDRIENLTLLSRAENLALRRRRWDKDKPRYDELHDSLKPTAILVAKLTVKTNERSV